MMEMMKNRAVLNISIILCSFFLSLYVYHIMPERMVTHWGITGAADGYSAKTFGLFMFGVLQLILYILLTYLPKIDPLQKKNQPFMTYYDDFIHIFLLFMLYMQLLVIGWNLGYIFDFIRLQMPAFSILFFAAGVMIGQVKRNWFIGIRTPWTLSSDYVWDRTHAVGAKLFKATAIITLLGVLWPNLAFVFLLGSVIIAALGSTAYSYFIYKKQV